MLGVQSRVRCCRVVGVDCQASGVLLFLVLLLLLLLLPQLTHPHPHFPPFPSPPRQVISYNAHRAHLIWPKLHGFLRGLLEDQVEVAIVRCPYLLERCVVTVLRAAVVVGMRSSQPPQQQQPQQQQPQQLNLPLITNNINTAAPQTHASTVVQTTQTPFAAANGTHSTSADPHHSAATATISTTVATPTATMTNHQSHPHPLLHPPSGVPLSMDNTHQAYGGGSLGVGPYGNTLTIRPSSYASSSSTSSSLAWLLTSLSLLKDLPSDLMTVVADRIAVGLLALVRHAGPGPSQNLHAVRLLTSGSGLAPAQGPGLAVGMPLFAQLVGHSGTNQLPIITTNTNTTTTTTTGVAIPITSTPIVTSTSTTMPMKNTSGSATASGSGNATGSGNNRMMIGLIEGGDQWGVVLSLLATAGARETYSYSPIHAFIHPYIHTFIHTCTNTLIRIYTPTRNITLT